MMTLTRFAFAMALGAVAMPADAASYIDQTSSYLGISTATLQNSASFNYSLIDYTKSASVGGIESTFAGKYGAKLTGTVGAKFNVNGGVGFTNGVSLVNAVKSRTVAGTFAGQGREFVIAPTTSFGSNIFNVGKGQVDVALNATMFAGANLSGKGCFIVCKGGTIVNYGLGDPQQFEVIGYHSATNSVQAFGQTYNNALPQHFEYGGLVPFSGDLQAINVGGTKNGSGMTAAFHTQQQIGGAFIDLAGALVAAFGIPPEAINGSLFGFDYSTVSAKFGAALNAIYDVTASVTATTKYVFSTPVQVFNQKTNKWSNASTSFATVQDGTALIARTVDPTSSVSVTPIGRISGTVASRLELQAAAEAHFRLLEAHGYGLDAGPLYQYDGSYPLGSAVFNAKTNLFSESVLKPFTLTFGAASNSPAALFADAFKTVERAGRETGYPAFVFVPDDVQAGGDYLAGEIKLAVNFGTFGCDDDSIMNCAFEEGSEPLRQQRRITRDATGAPIIEYGLDFASIEQLENLPEGTLGVQSTPESLRALLMSLPGDKWSYDLPPQVSFNGTPWIERAGVPEPASWAMMIGGFALLGGAMRRRRGIALRAA